MIYLPKVAKAAPQIMANRSYRRLPNLFVTQAHDEADYVMRRRRADSIRARAHFKGPAKGRIYASNRIPQPSADSLPPRLSPYMLQRPDRAGRLEPPSMKRN